MNLSKVEQMFEDFLSTYCTTDEFRELVSFHLVGEYNIQEWNEWDVGSDGGSDLRSDVLKEFSEKVGYDDIYQLLEGLGMDDYELCSCSTLVERVNNILNETV